MTEQQTEQQIDEQQIEEHEQHAEQMTGEEIFDQTVEEIKPKKTRKPRKKPNQTEKARSVATANRQIRKKKVDLFDQFLDGNIELSDDILKSHGFNKKQKETKKETHKETKKETQVQTEVQTQGQLNAWDTGYW